MAGFRFNAKPDDESNVVSFFSAHLHTQPFKFAFPNDVSNKCANPQTHRR